MYIPKSVKRIFLYRLDFQTKDGRHKYLIWKIIYSDKLTTIKSDNKHGEVSEAIYFPIFIGLTIS